MAHSLDHRKDPPFQGTHRDLYQLIKLTQPSFEANASPQFSHPQAEFLSKGILKMRGQIAELARELNRSLSNEGQIQDYLQELIVVQELIRRLSPLRNSDSLMNLVLELSSEIMNSEGSIFYLWDREPFQFLQRKRHNIDEKLEVAIEEELRRNLDGSEQQPLVTPFFRPSADSEATLILIPLVSGRRQLGVFVAFVNTSHLQYFGYHLNIFAMFGQAVTSALENAVLFEEVQRLSVRDDLTGLYNARYLRTYLDEQWSQAAKDQPLVLLFMDVDRFKSVNDTHGHLVGSGVLTEMAELINGFAGEAGCACRYGGDEFVLALPQMGLEKAVDLAEEIRFEAEITDFNRAGGMRINLSLSIGIAIYPQQARSPEELINYADMAMYDSKTSGKNRVSVWREAGQAQEEASSH